MSWAATSGVAALVSVLLVVLGTVAYRKVKSSLDASTIAALERAYAAKKVENDELLHRVEVLERSDADKAKIIEVLSGTVTAKHEIAALSELVVAKHESTIEVLEKIGNLLTDIKGLAGGTHREGDPN